MHPNQKFRNADNIQNISFARERGFGILAVNGKSGPQMAHIPFLLSEDGRLLGAHLVRSNPMLKLIEDGIEAVIAVAGPDSYVSPDWYGVDNQVPTWNYVAVHLRGKLVRLPSDELHSHLQRMSDHFETRLVPKPIWKIEKMDSEIREKMKRIIVPVQLEVSAIDGTWKLDQNAPGEMRTDAAKLVADDGIGLEFKQLASLMDNPPC